MTHSTRSSLLAAALSVAVAAPFDLADFEDVPAAELNIKNPLTGKPTEAVIELAGPEHPVRKRIAFERARRARAAMMRTGKVQLTDPEDDEATETDDLVQMTLGWRGLVIGGAPIEHTPAAALALYTDPKRRWLREQVREFLEERKAFIQPSAAG